jgi:hypothetical protein
LKGFVPQISLDSLCLPNLIVGICDSTAFAALLATTCSDAIAPTDNAPIVFKNSRLELRPESLSHTVPSIFSVTIHYLFLQLLHISTSVTTESIFDESVSQINSTPRQWGGATDRKATA